MEISAARLEPLKMMERVTTTGSDDDLASKPVPKLPCVLQADKNDEIIEKNGEGEPTARADPLKMSTGLLQFPENLMSLLDSGKVAEILRWLPDGDAFCLMPALFAERVLDTYFQGTKYESFTRKLNRWGFKRVAGQKVPPNTIAYYHKDFIRGSPKQLKNMNGGKSKNAIGRDKQLRAQQKLDEDSNALLLSAAQYQQSKKVDGVNDTGLKPEANRLGLVGSLGGSQMQFLTSHSITLEQQIQNRKIQLQQQQLSRALQNPFYSANHALALQRQNDEIQMALLLQQRSLQAMRDPTSSAAMAQHQWMNPQVNLPIGNSALSALQYARLQNDPSFGSNVDMSAAGRLLLAQQLGSSSSSGATSGSNDSTNAVLLQRLLQARAAELNGHGLSDSSSTNLNASDAAATMALQQQIIDEQRPLSSVGSTATSQTQSALTEQQLIELFLLQQQRNNGSTSGSNL